jgi:hypothetical protein
MSLAFVICVVIGFLAWFLATFPVPHAERVARGFFLAAAVIWAFGAIKGG